MKPNIEIGTRLQFPDGEYARVIDTVFYRDEEDKNGVYNALQVIFVIEGDEEKQTFDEMLDSRENYKFNVMKVL